MYHRAVPCLGLGLTLTSSFLVHVSLPTLLPFWQQFPHVVALPETFAYSIHIQALESGTADTEGFLDFTPSNDLLS